MFQRKAVTIIGIAVLLSVCGCDNPGNSVDKEQSEATAASLAEANRQIGMPNIVNFTQRKHMKMIYELCDKEGLICYAYTKSDYTGKLNYIGKCVGYGIPFSAQYTNPMRRLDGSSAGELTTIPQADPNGLFMPTSSSASWVMMIDPETNKPRPVYVEPEIVVCPFPLH